MTTLHAFEGGPKLCLPKPEHYKLLLMLLAICCWSSIFAYTGYSEDRNEKTTFFAPDTLRTDATIKISKDSIPDTLVIANCGLNVRFQSDMSSGILYEDSLNKPRNSIISFCPPDSKSQITFNFRSFGLEEGDTLYAYEGLIGHDIFAGSCSLQPFPGGVLTGTGAYCGNPILIAKASGQGPSQFNGGWAAATCDPTVNARGCVTFLFKTDGDFKKDIGWNASIECEERPVSLIPADNQFISLDCNSIKQQVTIGPVKIESTCNTLSNDSILINIINQEGTLCMDTCIRADRTFTIDTLAIGTYTVQYFLKADLTRCIKAEGYLAISPPVMVCNDDVIVSLGAACSATVIPDMLLENPCDTIHDTLYYNIIVRRPNGSILASGTSRNGQYPWIFKDSIDVCGKTRYQVEITRVYDYGKSCCSQGKIEDVCWGYMQFIDETGPVFYETTTDTVTICEVTIENLDRILKKPIITDNCDSVNVKLFDLELLEGRECDSIRVYSVIWKAEDQCGNQAVKKDRLVVLRPTIKNFTKLPNVKLNCGIDDESAINDFSITGIPKLILSNDTISLYLDRYVCNYILTKQDKHFPHPGGIKLFRYWSILDRCSLRPVPTVIDTQLIEFVDTLKPSIICPPQNKLESAERFPLEPFDCTREVSISPPLVVDDCDPNPTIRMKIVEQLIDGKWDSIAPNLAALSSLRADTFRVGWEAYDGSGNYATDTCYNHFILEDLTPPSAICKDELRVSFIQGETSLTVNEIDDISWDACGIAKREVRRTDEGIWRQYVEFVCEDVYEKTRVELRVTDVTGNQNICWLYVNVLDNVRPICETLKDTVAFCDEFFTDELGPSTDADKDERLEDSEWQPLTGDLMDFYNARFGIPSCFDNATCRVLSLQQEYQIVYSQCGKAQARRRYRAYDARQPTVVTTWQVQVINIDYRPDWSFTLPTDWAGECGDDLPSPFLEITRGACDILAWEYEDQIFDIVNDACFQINRTYYIINWCAYQQGVEAIDITRDENLRGDVADERVINAATYGNVGYFKYTQVIKVSDSNKPIVTINPVQTCIYGAGDIAPIGEEDVTLGASPYECDTIRVFSAEATDCEAAFFSNFSFEWWISEDGIEVGHGATKKFFWTVQPKTKYTVKYRVYDNCGNFGEKEEDFQFWDCTLPSILCQDNLVTGIRVSGTALVSPALIANRSYDNCTPQEALDYRIWHTSFSAAAPKTLEGIKGLPNALELGCDYEGIQPVNVFILDAEDNYSSCSTHIIIEDINNQCKNSGAARKQAAVAGKIVMENGSEVENVQIQVTGEGLMPDPYMTGTDGNYIFELNTGQVYNVVPKKNTNPLNGVTTFDLVLISKHILGITEIDSPYHLIAADINHSGKITAYDMVQLRQMILNIVTEFPNNESWRFIDASYEFTTNDPLSEPYNEVIAITLDGIDKMNNNFIAIKIGDINGNVLPSSLFTSEQRNSSETFTIQLQDKMVTAGEQVRVAFQSETINKIEGYQFALAYEGLELLEMMEATVKKDQVGWAIRDRQVLPISWNKTYNEESASQLFELTFNALKTAKLSDLISIHPTMMVPEAYSNNQELLGVALQFSESSPDFKLLQNKPNPFKDNTIIGFYLPMAGTTTLSILTMDGKLLKEWSKYADSGYNEWTINSQSLPERGILYYQLSTGELIQTKKMILLE